MAQIRRVVSHINGRERLEGVQDSVLGRVFGRKEDEVTGDWRKLSNEDLHISGMCRIRNRVANTRL